MIDKIGHDCSSNDLNLGYTQIWLINHRNKTFAKDVEDKKKGQNN